MNKSLLFSKINNGLTRILFGLRNRHFFALDLLSFCLAGVLALGLRVETLEEFLQYTEALALYVLIATALRWMIFIPFGLYARYWRYASIDELAQIILATGTATLLVALVFFGVLRPFGLLGGGLPRSMPFLDGILVLLAVGGLRYSVRFVERTIQRRRNHRAGNKRVAIIGAGSAGVMMAREMHANPQLGLKPVVFLDDAPRKQGSLIYGIPVVGDHWRIGDVVRDHKVEQAVIAMPTASGKTIREVMRLCQAANIPCRTVPGIFELLDGSVTINQLRPVDIADLLRREPVVTDLTQVARLLKGKRILVTGAGGSIGAEICRQVAHHGPGIVLLLGHGETSLFHVANELRQAFPQLQMQTIVADIRDWERMRMVWERCQPQIVFHAAAHKHVSLMEENVEDAVSNNVQGTQCVLSCAEIYGVEQFVLISTDKAVNPSSAMGATKRVAELLAQQAAAQTSRCFVAVRFGNVLGSRGSVVPLFKQQISSGGPVTVTHPEVRRYFMTIPEAVQLVLQATTLGRGGEIFTLDMGDPIRILDLARDLIRLSGLVEGEDIDIVFTGLRPGEKLYEELFIPGENCNRTSHEKIYVVRNGAGIEPFTQAQWASLPMAVDELVSAARAGDSTLVRRLLQQIVPEYHPPAINAEPTPPGATLAHRVCTPPQDAPADLIH